MARTGKRTQMAEPQDRISNLPDNVIENILDRLPLVDTVATSILSRKWRHHWTRVSNLLLDENFTADVRELGELRNEEYTQEMMESDYMDAVNTFLLFHSGPIRNFVLHLPFNVEGPLMQAYVDKWIRVLSQKGVRELTLDARARTFMVFNLPSYVFDYLELRRLELRFCQFKLPYNFGGFQNLTSLQLLRVRIYEDGLTTLIANGPLLENLSIERYFGSLSINAPKLKTLSARSCGFKDFALRNVSDVVTISLRHTWTKRSATRPFRCDILNVLAGYDVPKTLPTPLECLMNLTLLDLHLDAPKHISCALCILRSSPYLQTANFKFLIKNSIASVEEEANVVAFLEDQVSEADSLTSLLIVKVKVKGLMGTRPQIMFLKFILTSSPALGMVYANAEANISKGAELTMMCDLMECSRASNKAEMSYSRSQGITAVSSSKAILTALYSIFSGESCSQSLFGYKVVLVLKFLL